MSYETAFQANDSLIKSLGEGNAYLIWALGLYLEEPDLEALASEALTDGPNDKKIDFFYLDKGNQRLIIAQGYYSSSQRDAAPANKASDLNTATAWLFSGDLSGIPIQLRPAIEAFRQAFNEGDIQFIELLYVHNLPESVNVTRELQTAADHLRSYGGNSQAVAVTGRELGRSRIEYLFTTQESHIAVKDDIQCPAVVSFTESGPSWRAYVLSVPGSWLHGLFSKYGESLFSANYRGFLGINRRKRINSGILQSAESKAADFWVFNNGITMLTLAVKNEKSYTALGGISIINGAQTTGSLGSIDIQKYDLQDVRVLCRIIECTDEATINDIVRYNNTQNEIMTWDQYSNDPDQNRIKGEFDVLGYKYSQKRGFRLGSEQIGVEEVAQPLVAFHGRFDDANSGKNRIFERRPLYQLAFSNRKARHILLVYTLSRAIDERRIELKNKSSNGSIISIEEKQLALMRNLRFKYFFISVIAKLLEVILSQKMDLDTIAFLPPVASSSSNSLVDLTAAWTPIVEAVVTYLATIVQAPDLARRISEEHGLDNIVKQLEGLLYAGRASLRVEAFRGMVADA